MKIKNAMILVVLVLGNALAAMANADIYVIANPSVDISAESLRDVFLGEKLMATGVKLVPVDNAVSQAEFLTKVILMDQSKYTAIWTKKGFRDGLNPPDIKPSDADILTFVRKTPGAIGYIGAMPGSASGFKIIKKF